MSEEYSEEEEVMQYFQDKEKQEHLYGDKQRIEDSISFKTYLLELASNKLLGGLLNRDIPLGFLGSREVGRINNDLELASDLEEIGLKETAGQFIKRAHIIANVSKGHKGQQQNALITNIDKRQAEINTKKRNFFGRGSQ